MSEIAENDKINAPSPEALWRSAQRLATVRVPRLVGVDGGELKDRVAPADDLRGALGEVSQEVARLLEWDRTRAVEEIAADRRQAFWLRAEHRRGGDRAGGRPSSSFPLADLDRVVLGGGATRQLMIEAERLRGAAERDPKLADMLERRYAEEWEALVRLDGPTETVNDLAEVLAASIELDRRKLVEQAKADLAAGRLVGFDLVAQGAPRAPVEQHRQALGSVRAEVLGAYSNKIAKGLRALDLEDAVLDVMATPAGAVWSGFDRNSSRELDCLERDRAAVFGQRLEAAFRSGTGMNAAPDVEASDAKLAEIDRWIERELRNPGNADELLRENMARAALQDAASRIAIERATGLARSSPS